MFNQHVGEKLSSYLHQQLPPPEMERVRAHLETCADCRKEFDEIRFGAALAQHLPQATAPADLWQKVEAGLSQPVEKAGYFHQHGWRWAAAAAMLLFCLALFFAWPSPQKPRMSFNTGDDRLTAFEQKAVELHLGYADHKFGCDFYSREPQPLQQWVAANTGLKAQLSTPPAEKHYRYIGAKSAAYNEQTAAAIWYLVDEDLVTMYTAKQEVAGQPWQMSPLRKSITAKYDARSGTKVLTWSRDGQAYVLVSKLPDFGQGSCFACHSDPRKRELIEGLTVTQ